MERHNRLEPKARCTRHSPNTNKKMAYIWCLHIFFNFNQITVECTSRAVQYYTSFWGKTHCNSQQTTTTATATTTPTTPTTTTPVTDRSYGRVFYIASNGPYPIGSKTQTLSTYWNTNDSNSSTGVAGYIRQGCVAGAVECTHMPRHDNRAEQLHGGPSKYYSINSTVLLHTAAHARSLATHDITDANYFCSSSSSTALCMHCGVTFVAKTSNRDNTVRLINNRLAPSFFGRRVVCLCVRSWQNIL